MNFSELLYKRFNESKDLVKHLTSFCGVPAVFITEAPKDDQKGWNNKVQYPKIIFNYDMQANEERNSTGTLSVDLLCKNTEDVVPEDIEAEIRKALRDVILKPSGGVPYCFAWARTDAFTIDEKSTDITFGSEVRFDILEYPSQETTDPDPVMAVNRYIKELYPDCLVIGYDRMDEITEATADRPVIYCRLVSIDKSTETNTVAWMDGVIAIHFLCPDSEVRIKMATAVANNMSLDGEITMLDYSPMTIRRLQANYKSDYLKQGQVFVTGHYGILRYQRQKHKITSVQSEIKWN